MHLSFLLSMRRVWILIGVISLLFIPTLLEAQDCGGTGKVSKVTNSGTEFLVCFMQNELPTYDAPPSEFQDIYLASIDPVNTTTVTITCRQYPAVNQVITLLPNASQVVHVIGLPQIVGPPNDGIINTEGTEDSTVFKVVADHAITCYGMNSKLKTADAFLALPINVASTEYRILSYPNSVLQSQEEPSEFCVAAFQTPTTVTITPSSVTRDGKSARVIQTYVLDSGTAVQIQTVPTTPLSDMTGSIVMSDKPVAVYAGHGRTEVPTGYFYPDVGVATSRDHIADAMPPASTWGFSFVAKNFANTGRPIGDLMRVMAKNDNTVVKLNNVVWGAPLSANEHRDTLITFVTNNALANIATVESDPQHPLLVGMIAHTALNSTHLRGDPFLAIVPPLQQVFNDYTYFIPQAAGFDPTQNFLIVVTEKGGASPIDAIHGHIIIDPGTPAADTPLVQSYTMIPNPLNNGNSYAVLTIQQNPGIHRILWSGAAAPQGFNILAFGWGEQISYGYTAGALYKPTNGIEQRPSPLHGAAPGNPSPKTPSIIVRNITNEMVYFDSVQISYSENSDHNRVRLKKDIALDIGTIDMAQEETLELVTAKPVVNPVSGKIRIFYHSAKWTDMYPVDFFFTINPQPAAGVGDEGGTETYTLLENYPNPSTAGKTTVHIIVPQGTFANVKIYDALGRVVRTVMQHISQTGEEAIEVSTKGLSAGDYTLELLVPERGISKHTHLVVVE